MIVIVSRWLTRSDLLARTKMLGEVVYAGALALNSGCALFA